MPAEKDSAAQKVMDQVVQQAEAAVAMVVMAVQPLHPAQAEAADTVLMAAMEDNM